MVGSGEPTAPTPSISGIAEKLKRALEAKNLQVEVSQPSSSAQIRQIEPSSWEQLRASSFTLQPKTIKSERTPDTPSQTRFVLIPPTALTHVFKPATLRPLPQDKEAQAMEAQVFDSLQGWVHRSPSPESPSRPRLRPILLHSFWGCLMLHEHSFDAFMGVALRCLRVSLITKPKYRFTLDCVNHNEVRSYLITPETAQQVFNEGVKPQLANEDILYRLRIGDELDLDSFYPPLKHKIVLYDTRVGAVIWQPRPPLWLDCPDDTDATSPTTVEDTFTKQRLADRCDHVARYVVPYLYPIPLTRLYKMTSTVPANTITGILNSDRRHGCLVEDVQKQLYDAMPRYHPVMLELVPIVPTGR